MRVIVFLLHVAAALLAAGLGVLCILQGLETFPWSDIDGLLTSYWGEVLLFALGAVLLLVSLHFVLGAVRNRGRGLRFTQEGEWGRIELSGHALREFVTGILRDEVGIERFRVRIRRVQGGIAISVETALSPQERVSEVGRRIQTTLARRVVERTGVDVREIVVLVENIRSRAERGPGEEETNAYYQS